MPSTGPALELTYVCDAMEGLHRRRNRGGFRYLDAEGRPVSDAETLARIKSLAIPPAWVDVWICSLPDGHLQATGRDARGRKQYRYHPAWRQIRDQSKYERTLAFAEALPCLRERVELDLRRRGLPREKVLATVVRLLELTLIRVGNEEYRRANNSTGLTTMRDRHVDINGTALHFQFAGKSGKRHSIHIRDRMLTGIVRRCREVRGYPLFQYLDEAGGRHQVTSSDVNAYLRDVMGAEFTAKDFRTWAGTVLTAAELRRLDCFESMAEAKRNLVQAIENVARQLGNTPAVCRKSYVHPHVVDCYLEGGLAAMLEDGNDSFSASEVGLDPEEAAVLSLLRRSLRARSGA
jgi:DNA topoisomerase-1